MLFRQRPPVDTVVIIWGLGSFPLSPHFFTNPPAFLVGGNWKLYLGTFSTFPHFFLTCMINTCMNMYVHVGFICSINCDYAILSWKYIVKNKAGGFVKKVGGKRKRAGDLTTWPPEMIKIKMQNDDFWQCSRIGQINIPAAEAKPVVKYLDFHMGITPLYFHAEEIFVFPSF